MTGKQEQKSTQAQTVPLSIRFLLWTRWAVYGFACVGYLSGLLTTPHLTLIRLLLLTITYGAWIVIFSIAQRTLRIHIHLPWLLTLFCLACASQFIPLPSTNPYWLPLLPIMTASMMVAVRPHWLGLLAVGVLFGCSYVSFDIIIPQWVISSQVTLLLSFVAPCVYMLMVRRLIAAYTALDSSNIRLAEANARLQEYSTQAEELSVIRERNRIAREIHDTLGHSLTLLSVQLETATQLEARADPRLHEELLAARGVVKDCLMEVRHSVEALRPDESSLQMQLRRLVAEFTASCHGTVITLDLEEATRSLHPEVSMTLYRCAQEALTNIRKHAHATRVLLRLLTSDELGEQVELTVLDDGQGGASVHPASGFGLLGMRERVALLNGTLQAGPEPGHGWRVEVVLPLYVNRKRDETGSWQNVSA